MLVVLEIVSYRQMPVKIIDMFLRYDRDNSKFGTGMSYLLQTIYLNFQSYTCNSSLKKSNTPNAVRLLFWTVSTVTLFVHVLQRQPMRYMYLITICHHFRKTISRKSTCSTLKFNSGKIALELVMGWNLSQHKEIGVNIVRLAYWTLYTA